ncbi:MAG: hypothetical protein AB7H88_16755 [Vicinamibacterales bacterium]
MRTSTLIVVAILLAVAGAVLWRVAGIEQVVAEGERELAVLHYGDPPTTLAGIEDGTGLLQYIPSVRWTITQGIYARATSRFWSGQFASLASEADTKPFLAANAAYREVQREGGPWRAVVGRLDAVITAYADAMRRQPYNIDAAYNYELAIRMRDVIATAQVDISPAPAPTVTGDLPDGPSVHGDEGAPPEASDTKQFKMIVPMRPDERMEAEQAGRSGEKKKKG